MRGCLATLVLMTLTAGCGGAGDGSPVVREGEPEIERIEATGSTEIPPHVLICGYNKVLDDPFEVSTYLQDDGLSLYDFAHSEDQLRTWMRSHPGGRAYGFRKQDTEGQDVAAIGRRITEPCLGTGVAANDE